MRRLKYALLCLILSPVVVTATELSAKQYIALEFEANRLQDTSPRLNQTQLSLPAPLHLKKTKYFANAQLYFAPQTPGAPIYMSVNYNFRKENHQLVSYDTGLRLVEMFTAKDQNQKLVEAAKELAVRANAINMQADFSEPLFDVSHVLAQTTNHSDGELVKRLAQLTQRLQGEATDHSELGLSDDAILALPPQSDAGIGLEFQAELSVVYTLDDDDPTGSIFVKRRYYGQGKTRTLNAQEVATIDQLSLLMGCGRDLKSRAN